MFLEKLTWYFERPFQALSCFHCDNLFSYIVFSIEQPQLKRVTSIEDMGDNRTAMSKAITPGAFVSKLQYLFSTWPQCSSFVFVSSFCPKNFEYRFFDAFIENVKNLQQRVHSKKSQFILRSARSTSKRRAIALKPSEMDSQVNLASLEVHSDFLFRLKLANIEKNEDFSPLKL